MPVNGLSVHMFDEHVFHLGASSNTPARMDIWLYQASTYIRIYRAWIDIGNIFCIRVFTSMLPANSPGTLVQSTSLFEYLTLYLVIRARSMGS